jgi:hypothetical protein
MRKGYLKYEEMRKYLVIHEETISHMTLHLTPSEFLINEENFLFLFNSVWHVNFGRISKEGRKRGSFHIQTINFKK